MIVFVENKLLTEQENLEENLKIEEMATLRKSRSGLPANLYLDDVGTWSKSGHWKRIKFQPNAGDRPVTRDMVPMSIDDNPQILVKNAKIELNAKQLNQIKAFVKANKDLLLQLADAEIEMFEFGRRMVKV
jgi:predicted metallo-beta-lactamase superfamily hydrolase